MGMGGTDALAWQLCMSKEDRLEARAQRRMKREYKKRKVLNRPPKMMFCWCIYAAGKLRAVFGHEDDPRPTITSLVALKPSLHQCNNGKKDQRSCLSRPLASSSQDGCSPACATKWWRRLAVRAKPRESSSRQIATHPGVGVPDRRRGPGSYKVSRGAA